MDNPHSVLEDGVPYYYTTHLPDYAAAGPERPPVGGEVGGGLLAGHADGLDLLKFGGSFVPVVGSMIAVGDAYGACRPLF